MTAFVSELFDAERWRTVPGFEELTDLTYHQDVTGRIARVAFNRPEVRNAFRPQTVDELAGFRGTRHVSAPSRCPAPRAGAP